MSHLALYTPEVEDEPWIVSFPTPLRDEDFHPSTISFGTTPLDRARLLHQNRTCPCCGHGAVEPLELRDGQLDRFHRVIPGTATIVGFHCLHCENEWRAES